MVRALPRPPPWVSGRMPRTRTSPSRSSACTLVQWKPISSPPRSARKNPAGSNHASALRSSRSRWGEGALLGVVGEGGGVDREPGGVVPPRHEGPYGHALGETRVRQLQVGQRAPHLTQFAEQGQPEHLREMPRGGVAAVRPDPQPRLPEAASSAEPSARPCPCPRCEGVDDQFGGRRLDRVGALQLGVADEFAAVHAEQQVRDALPRGGRAVAAGPVRTRPAVRRCGRPRRAGRGRLRSAPGRVRRGVSIERGRPGCTVSSLVMRTRVRGGCGKPAAVGAVGRRRRYTRM